MKVDNNSNYHARLNTNYRVLSSNIIGQHVVWTCSNMIVDDIFYRINLHFFSPFCLSLFVRLCIYIYIHIYIYSVGGKRQINYQFVPTDLFRGCPLIRGFNENNLYHRLYTDMIFTFLSCCCLCVRRWLGKLLMVAGSFRRAGMCSLIGSRMYCYQGNLARGQECHFRTGKRADDLDATLFRLPVLALPFSPKVLGRYFAGFAVAIKTPGICLNFALINEIMLFGIISELISRIPWSISSFHSVYLGKSTASFMLDSRQETIVGKHRMQDFRAQYTCN